MGRQTHCFVARCRHVYPVIQQNPQSICVELNETVKIKCSVDFGQDTCFHPWFKWANLKDENDTDMVHPNVQYKEET